MSTPPNGRRTPLWKRIVWLLVAAGLIAAVVSIYLFLRPSPRRLADPEEFNLASGERFELEDLPMGSRYRLRACEQPSALRADIGTFSTGWSRIAANPADDPALDLRIDGRNGGTMVVEAREPTGRLILFRERMKVTCRGDVPVGPPPAP